MHYTAAITASNYPPSGVEHGVGLVHFEADDDEQALERALALAQERWPREEWWGEHQAVVERERV